MSFASNFWVWLASTICSVMNRFVKMNVRRQHFRRFHSIVQMCIVYYEFVRMCMLCTLPICTTFHLFTLHSFLCALSPIHCLHFFPNCFLRVSNMSLCLLCYFCSFSFYHLVYCSPPSSSSFSLLLMQFRWNMIQINWLTIRYKNLFWLKCFFVIMQFVVFAVHLLEIKRVN